MAGERGLFDYPRSVKTGGAAKKPNSCLHRRSSSEVGFAGKTLESVCYVEVMKNAFSTHRVVLATAMAFLTRAASIAGAGQKTKCLSGLLLCFCVGMSPVARGGPTSISSIAFSNGVVRFLIASNDPGTLVLYGGTNVLTITNLTLSIPMDRFNREVVTTNVPGQSQAFFRAELHDGSQFDSDGDGMSDQYELQWGLFLNPTNAADAALDANSNGISNLAEYQQGRSPVFPRPQRQSLSGGAQHVTAIAPNGAIYTWGQNQVGQFGNLMPNPRYLVYDAGCWSKPVYPYPSLGPLPLASTNDWLTLAAGDYHTLAIKTNGTLWAWGDYSYGQLGTTNGLAVVTNPGSMSVFADHPLQVGTNANWRSVFAANYRSYGIRNDGTLWGWGWNPYGIIGQPTTLTFSPVPLEIGSQTNWVHVSSWGYSYSGIAVGIQADGSLWAWGQTALPGSIRDMLVVSNSAVLPVTNPAPVRVPGPWLDAAAVGTVIYAVRADGSLWTVNDILLLEAVPIQSYNNFVQQLEAAGYDLAFINQLYVEATMRPIPDVAAFQRDASDEYLFQPASVRGGWMTVRGNQAGFIALNKDGTLWTTETGSQRSGNAARDGVWQQVNSDTDWRSVAAFVDGFAAQKNDGRVWSWGLHNILSEDHRVNGSVPLTDSLVQIPGTNKWQSALKGPFHVAALDITSNLWLWGVNDKGQLGTGDREPRFVPTRLSKSGPWLSYTVGYDFTLGVFQDGSLWAWGHYTRYGDSRDATWAGDTAPVQIMPGTQWKAVLANTLAMDVNGGVWAWGYNFGLLASGTPTNVFAQPTLITNLPGCSQISVNGDHGLAIATNGALYAWGNNQSGQLGLGLSTNNIAHPTPLGGSAWKWVYAGDLYSLGIKTDGTLWGWGDNYDVQLGITNLYVTNISSAWSCTVPIDPNTTYPDVYVTGFPTNSPGQVGTESNWRTAIATAQNRYSAGLKNDGTLWMWGRSLLASVTNQPYLTPTNHLYPNIPYPSDTGLIPNPVRVGQRSDWIFLSQDAAITADGTLYLWGENPGGQLTLPPAWQLQQVNSNIVFRITPVP